MNTLQWDDVTCMHRLPSLKMKYMCQVKLKEAMSEDSEPFETTIGSVRDAPLRFSVSYACMLFQCLIILSVLYP